MAEDQDLVAFEQGLTASQYAQPDMASAMREERMTKWWFEEIDRSRRFHDKAFRQLAKDRAYAAGQTTFPVSVNVIGSYIDTWRSLLNARNPDVDVMPVKELDRPTPKDPLMAAMMAQIPVSEEDRQLLAKTLEMVISRYWRKANMKAASRSWVSAALTSKVGWLKVTFQARQGQDLATTSARNDLMENLARVTAMIAEAEEGYDCGDLELQKGQLEAAIEGLQTQAEAEVKRSLCIDPVDMLDMTLADSCPSAARYQESPWIGHRIYIRLAQAKADYPDLNEDDWKTVALYALRKPGENEADEAALKEWRGADADMYVASTAVDKDAAFVEAHEIWHRSNNRVLTVIRGVKRYARKPVDPKAGPDFYPFFNLAFTEVDGQFWQQSLNERSQTIQDDYNRTLTQWAEHRRRVKPKQFFNSSAIDQKQVVKITKAVVGEMVGLKLLQGPKGDISKVLFTPSYPQIDPMLYTLEPLLQQFEMIWGLQEAMTATLNTPKTATEAEIQQSGTQSRTGDKRDILEERLTQVANFTAWLLLQELTREEVEAICGPAAYWPRGLTAEDLNGLVSVEIRAGSSGKPNLQAQRESWGAVLPMLQGLIQQIAILRQTPPDQLADCYEELAKETLDRSGDRVDLERFMPQLGAMAGMPMLGMPGAPGPGGLPPEEPAPVEGAPPEDPGFPVQR